MSLLLYFFFFKKSSFSFNFQLRLKININHTDSSKKRQSTLIKGTIEEYHQHYTIMDNIYRLLNFIVKKKVLKQLFKKKKTIELGLKNVFFFKIFYLFVQLN